MRNSLVRRSVIAAAVGLAVVAVSPASARPSAPEPAKLTAAAGTANAKFGTSVAIDGNTAVVGAPDEGGAGAAYVFTRRGGVWTEEATLVAPVHAEGAKFGYDVALSGDTIVVGAANSDQTPIPEAGVAYVFVRTRDGWAQQAKLSASDGKTDDAFGFAVDISGDTIVVGANDGNVAPGVTAGAAYVFSRVGGAWSEQAKLTPTGGAPDDGFGISVSVLGDTAVVGAGSDDVGASVDQGSARVFTRTGTTWTEQATLTANDGVPAAGFGGSTSISGDTVVVGAVADVVDANPKGSAYVFTHEGGAWTQKAKLTAPDGDPADQFGREVVVIGDTLAVGAHFNKPGGAVYMFERVNGRWAEPTKLTAGGSELLGVSVAMSGDTVIGGANFTDVDGTTDQGAAYVFDLRPRLTGTVAAQGTPSAAPSGSADNVAGPESGPDQVEAVGSTLPSTGIDTGARTLVALTALALGLLLAVSRRSVVS